MSDNQEASIPGPDSGPLANGETLFDRYVIERHIGVGGMGHVYCVKDTTDGSVLALKTMVPKAGKNEKAIGRFRKEFSAMHELQHPNIVRAHRLHDENPEFLGLAMELVEGKDLDQLIYDKGNALNIIDKLEILKQIANGLSYAHGAGLFHRDLKPANVLINNEMQVKIVDFGLAQQEADGADLSKSEARVGTAYYMSPEQHRGEELDARTDIYSFGIMAFELFTGQRPFDGNTPFKLFLAHVAHNLPEIRKINPEVPRWLATMIEICAEKKKKHRYASMKEIASLLEAKTRPKGDSFLSRILFKKKSVDTAQ